MMNSRGMGCIERGPSKGKPTAFAKGGEVPKLIRRKDAMEPVKVYNAGGVTRAAQMDGGVFVKAASKHGLTTDKETLNKIVRLVNEGHSADEAARKVAEGSYAKGGETRSTPKNPSLWSSVKAEAKSKFDVYPSAYANAWAAKEYKKRGGSWGGADNRVKRG